MFDQTEQETRTKIDSESLSNLHRMLLLFLFVVAKIDVNSIDFPDPITVLAFYIEREALKERRLPFCAAHSPSQPYHQSMHTIPQNGIILQYQWNPSLKGYSLLFSVFDLCLRQVEK